MEAWLEKKQNIAWLATESAGQYARLVLENRLKLRKGRLGGRYAIEDGRTYRIFRETVCTRPSADPAVLVVGFKLRWLGAKGLGHWLFQRVCILTTPFWSGFRGFRVKLWMVAPTSGHYLGIYEWDGKDSANHYVQALARVLRPLSLAGTVWYSLKPHQRLDAFMSDHDVRLTMEDKEVSHVHAIL